MPIMPILHRNLRSAVHEAQGGCGRLSPTLYLRKGSSRLGIAVNRRVTERHAVVGHLAIDSLEPLCLWLLCDFDREIENLKHPLKANHRGREVNASITK